MRWFGIRGSCVALACQADTLLRHWPMPPPWRGVVKFVGSLGPEILIECRCPAAPSPSIFSSLTEGHQLGRAAAIQCSLLSQRAKISGHRGSCFPLLNHPDPHPTSLQTLLLLEAGSAAAWDASPLAHCRGTLTHPAGPLPSCLVNSLCPDQGMVACSLLHLLPLCLWAPLATGAD